jgi:hypothetical protein
MFYEAVWIIDTIEEKTRQLRFSRIDDFFSNHLNQYLAFNEFSDTKLILDLHVIRLAN